MQHRTTIIIAHRLATIRHTDRIYVLEKGHIVEEGSHNDLIAKNNGVYQNLLKLQTDAYGNLQENYLQQTPKLIDSLTQLPPLYRNKQKHRPLTTTKMNNLTANEKKTIPATQTIFKGNNEQHNENIDLLFPDTWGLWQQVYDTFKRVAVKEEVLFKRLYAYTNLLAKLRQALLKRQCCPTTANFNRVAKKNCPQLIF